MAREHRIYIGASYLEADGDDFFNTFTFMKPGGVVAGRVRKQSLPGFEGWFFRGCSGPKVIETELGRIGVGICHDNNTAQFMRRMGQEHIDLMLMPHSAPCIALGALPLVGDHGRQVLRETAGFYAEAFGVPTVMANKAAGEDTWSPIPWVLFLRLHFHLLGQSTICDSDGTVREQLDEREGVVVADVVLDPQRKRRPSQLPSGYWSLRPPAFPRFPRASAAMFQTAEWIGKAGYRLSRRRRVAARKRSSNQNILTPP
jgi:N-carbamoylputrescine amidase